MSRPRILVVVLVVAVTSAGTGWAASGQLTSPARLRLAASAPSASPVTIAVQRKQVVARLVARATVHYEQPFTVRLLAAVQADERVAAALVTKTVAARQTVSEGQVLLEVSGRPVVVLQGAVPMYRSLRQGDSGADVAQLAAALSRLGLLHSTSAGKVFGAQLQRAVGDLYRRVGYSAPTATSTELEAVRSARAGARGAASQLADAQEAVTSQAQTDAAGVRRAQRALSDARAALDDAQASVANATEAARSSLPAGEIAFIPARTMRVDRMKVHPGDAATGDAAVLTGPRRLISVDVDAAQARLIHPGTAAKVDAGDGNPPVVARVDSSVLGGAAGEGQGRITLSAPLLPGGVAGDVKVTLDLRSTGPEALVVPLGALTTTGSGQAVVHVLGRDGHTTIVPVTPSLAADGEVAVAVPHGGLAPGDEVVVGPS